jgi:hypothetical protein
VLEISMELFELASMDIPCMAVIDEDMDTGAMVPLDKKTLRMTLLVASPMYSIP